MGSNTVTASNNTSCKISLECTSNLVGNLYVRKSESPKIQGIHFLERHPTFCVVSLTIYWRRFLCHHNL